jgi:4-diphosphocytidyl-2-C-methyl-D-erythritol kinase
MLVHAPAKLNLGLYLGRARPDGLHELCSLFEPLALADLLRITEAERDEVICPGVEGDNLAARALRALRERGWDAPPLRIEIEKRTPVAAGLGGGSADAAAVLRLAIAPFPAGFWSQENQNPATSEGLRSYNDHNPSSSEGSGSGDDHNPPSDGRFWSQDEPRRPGTDGGLADLADLAAELGADVPSQLRPGLALVRGAGERVEPLPAPAAHAALLLPGGGGLSTAAVFAEADRLGLGHDESALDEIAPRLRAVAGSGASPLTYADLLINDLEPAAISLRPDIGTALESLRRTDAPAVFLSGSGPTAVALFGSFAEADAAARTLSSSDAIVCLAGAPPTDPPSLKASR